MTSSRWLWMMFKLWFLTKVSSWGWHSWISLDQLHKFIDCEKALGFGGSAILAASEWERIVSFPLSCCQSRAASGAQSLLAVYEFVCSQANKFRVIASLSNKYTQLDSCNKTLHGKLMEIITNHHLVTSSRRSSLISVKKLFSKVWIGSQRRPCQLHLTTYFHQLP